MVRGEGVCECVKRGWMSVERVRRDEGWCVRDERGEAGRGRGPQEYDEGSSPVRENGPMRS